ncbi:MAG TPA: GNAT family N-acetyltransferase [Vicinamibacteria bacterium]|nr:GNAT family N-acetyltransferase [Vicinamibacteria bacterium]
MSSNSPSARAKIEICRRSSAETPALEAMYVEVFGEKAAGDNRARWRWQYDENPNCPPEGPEIWVAKQNGVVLGQYASMPVRLYVKGRTLRASWGMDVMVRPHVQRKGIGSRLFLYWDENVEASLGLGLSAASYALFKKLRWEDVGPVPCYTLVLDPGALLERRMPRPLARALAPLARLAFSIAFPRRKTRGAVTARLMEGNFGEEYDALWQAASPGYDFIAERTAAYLEWKYHRVPFVSYDVLEARRKDGTLSGYCVLRATERNGVVLALLVDLFAGPEDDATLGALLDGAGAWAMDRKAARMQTFTFDDRIAARLAAKGFLLIPSPMQFCLRIHSDHVSERFYRDTSRWHVTFGDSDQDREA